MSKEAMDRNGLDVVRENRRELKELADSDLPAAWIAECLLNATDDGG
jgi:hypothetical protein